MSHYNKIKTQIKNRNNLVKALCKMGFTEDQIRVCDTAEHLEGYEGRKRPETANVIIPRKYVGGAANDIGWKLGEDGTYEAIISDYDKRKYNTAWCGKMETHYGIEQSKEAFTMNGWSYSEQVTEEGEVQLIGVMY
jgi:hypothetical protein